MVLAKSRKQNEKALGWTHDMAADLFHCVTGYGIGGLSPQVGGKVRGVKRCVGGSVARAGLKARYSSAINMIIETSGWMQDCYFECIFVEKSYPKPEENSQLGDLAITWGGIDSRYIVPCLQARINVDRNIFSDINMMSLEMTKNPCQITIDISRLVDFGFEQFWEKMKKNQIPSMEIVNFQINSTLGNTYIKPKFRTNKYHQENSFIFSQPH